MVYTDDGIQEMHKTAIRNDSGETPLFVSFAGIDNTYLGTEETLTDEFIRKSVTWASSGINSLYTAELTSAEAVGSYIGTVGLTGGSDLGSDVLFTTDESFIGTKGTTFNIQVEGEIIIQRLS